MLLHVIKVCCILACLLFVFIVEMLRNASRSRSFLTLRKFTFVHAGVLSNENRGGKSSLKSEQLSTFEYYLALAPCSSTLCL